MALQNFVDYVGPKISAAWLNAVDALKFTVFGDAVTKPTARTALTSDAPLEILNGGTGVRTLTDLKTVIGNAIYPEISVETSAGISPVNTSYPPGNLLRYGNNTVPGTTDMSVALQNAINLVALGGFGDIIVPRGLYLITTDIYFHYDVANNPTFPSTAGSWGMINIVGEGWQDYTAHVNNVLQGSILTIGAKQLKIGKGVQGTRGVRFRNCTVKGNSATYLIKYDFASRGCGMDDFTLFQAGIGGGVEMNDTFLTSLRNIDAHSTNGVTTGIGFFIHNATQSAGLFDLNGVSVVSFAKNFVFGEESTASGASMNGITMNGCQGNGGQYNLIFGFGAKGIIVNAFHNEAASVIGVQVVRGASNIRFESMYSSSAANATTDYMSLGQNTGTAADDDCKNISVLNCIFTGIKRVGINVYASGSANISNREIANCSFQGAVGTETGIELENVAQRGLTVGPNRYTVLAVEVSNPSRIDILRADDTFGVTTYQAPLIFNNYLQITAVVSPAAFNANVADYNPASFGSAVAVRLTATGAPRNISGMVAGGDGDMKILYNIGAIDIVLTDEDAASVAANRFALKANVTLNPDGSAIVRYDATTARWRMCGGVH